MLGHKYARLLFFLTSFRVALELGPVGHWLLRQTVLTNSVSVKLKSSRAPGVLKRGLIPTQALQVLL